MLRTKLIHPEILNALAKLGHGSQVLIADGNYPFATASHPNASHVYLNLAPGLVSATDVLRALLDVITIEGAAVMAPDSGRQPSIWREFRACLPKGIVVEGMARSTFYEAARSFNTGLVIATGEQRIYGNLLLTIGVVK